MSILFKLRDCVILLMNSCEIGLGNRRKKLKFEMMSTNEQLQWANLSIYSLGHKHWIFKQRTVPNMTRSYSPQNQSINRNCVSNSKHILPNYRAFSPFFRKSVSGCTIWWPHNRILSSENQCNRQQCNVLSLCVGLGWKHSRRGLTHHLHYTWYEW